MRAFLTALSALLVFLAPAMVGAVTPELQHELEPSPRQNISSSNADSSWRPSVVLQSAVEAVTRAYFAARDSSRAEDAYAFLSPRQKQYVPFAGYKGMLEDFNARAGEKQSRRMRAVTWYKDTPQAGPGLYVAVDYSSEFSGLALHCGYLVWHQQTDGSFLITREESNVIDNATMSRLKLGDLEKVRAQFRC